ncbi:SDR family NAD(P)-dependent oxidoreductase [Amycolatopsis anabasis]|uniref:SDR family NAD(P)-dependent oxidoreductase n=1 Tax=Amycolatopsis anabasis TaxID=1840409 RepID=UPI00131BA05E|nr:SDR family oxidoreductase [Amycolatopsis anabasis]
MTEARSLQGRAVIVTGGGTGIGRVTAHEFANAGASVLVVGRTAERLAETAAGRPDIHTFVADVGSADGPRDIVTAAMRAFGRIDVLVNNAGITRPATLDAIGRDEAEDQLRTNLLGPLFLAQQALPHLQTSRGVIINVTSNIQHRGWPGNSIFGSTKVALDFLTNTWAVELAERGIRVVSVAPGFTDTPALAHAGFTPEEVAALGAELVLRIPLRRTAQPEEIAWWIVNVARPEGEYLNGVVVRVDGGLAVA